MSNLLEEMVVSQELSLAENEAELLETAQLIQYVAGTFAQSRLTAKFVARRDYLRALAKGKRQ